MLNPDTELKVVDLPNDIFFLVIERVLSFCDDTPSKFKALIILTLTCKDFRKKIYEGDGGYFWRSFFARTSLEKDLPLNSPPSIFGPKILSKVPEILKANDEQNEKRVKQAIRESNMLQIITFWIIYAKKISLTDLGLFSETHNQKAPFDFFWRRISELPEEKRREIYRTTAFKTAKEGKVASLRICVNAISAHHENATHTLLAHAVKHRQPSAVACILNAEIPPTEVDQVHSQTGETALEVAVKEFDFFIHDRNRPSVITIGLLCAAGAARQRIILSDRFRLIQRFARHPQSPVLPVQEYLSHPPEISPHVACVFDHPTVLEHALTRNLPDLDELMELAFVAIISGSTHCLDFLLVQEYVSVQSTNAEGLTLLALAVREGEIESIEVLLSKGADLDARLGDDENTPLHLLCSHEKLEDELLPPTISHLLTYPVNVTARNKSGDTAMEILGRRIDAAAASSKNHDHLSKAYRAFEKALEKKANSAVASSSQCRVM